jgi:predicted ester cyclase
MDGVDLRARHLAYLDCLNRRAWAELDAYVAEEVHHNGRAFGVAGYRAMLEQDVEQIPDLRFDARLLVVSGAEVAARLEFDCHPRGTLLGVAVDGRRVRFAEHVFYRYAGGRIAEVWSVLDAAGLRASLDDVSP